jgi:hypothetical protein
MQSYGIFGYIIIALKKFLKALCQERPDNVVWRVNVHLGQ